MEEPPNTKNLIGILKRVMNTDKTAMETDETESSDILLAKSSSDRATTSTTLYTRDNSRPYCPARRVRSERYERGNSYERERDPRKTLLGLMAEEDAAWFVTPYGTMLNVGILLEATKVSLRNN